MLRDLEESVYKNPRVVYPGGLEMLFVFVFAFLRSGTLADHVKNAFVLDLETKCVSI
jgi:hypothetical protein